MFKTSNSDGQANSSESIRKDVDGPGTQEHGINGKLHSQKSGSLSGDKQHAPLFDPEYLKIERILCASNMYPLLHPMCNQKI